MKIIKIESCIGCYWHWYDILENQHRCDKLQKRLRNINPIVEIHPDCPLEDYKEI